MKIEFHVENFYKLYEHHYKDLLIKVIHSDETKPKNLFNMMKKLMKEIGGSKFWIVKMILKI